MQNLIGILQIDVTYFKGSCFAIVVMFVCVKNLFSYLEWELMEPRVPVTIEARLGYRNKGDPDDEWKEYATSTEMRSMDCSPPEVASNSYFSKTFHSFLLTVIFS